jgi:hypothetical protein
LSVVRRPSGSLPPLQVSEIGGKVARNFMSLWYPS